MKVRELIRRQCIHFYKYAVVIPAAGLLLWSGGGSIVMAEGGINGNEARVIGVASGTFEYNGEMYSAAPGYVGELRAYLSKDGVDLTAAQADAAINKIYANVETGVKEGYIVKVGGGDDSSDKPDKTKKPKKTEKPDDKPAASPSPSPTPEPTRVPTVVNKDDGTIDIHGSSGDRAASFSGNMKNTGFNIQNTCICIWCIACLMVMLVIYCIIYFARQKKYNKNNIMIARESNVTGP